MPKKRSRSTTKRYDVGYGRPPKHSQFKKGRSGNPAGINRKATVSIAPDLKAILERALNEEIELRQGERVQFISIWAAGIRVLAEQFAQGDARARRDLIAFMDKLGIDPTAEQSRPAAVSYRSEAEFRQALIERGIPARLMPPIDSAGFEPPPDPPLPADVEDE